MRVDVRFALPPPPPPHRREAAGGGRPGASLLWATTEPEDEALLKALRARAAEASYKSESERARKRRREEADSAGSGRRSPPYSRLSSLLSTAPPTQVVSGSPVGRIFSYEVDWKDEGLTLANSGGYIRKVCADLYANHLPLSAP